MQRGIGEGEFEPEEERRDTEVTLGPMMLAAMFFALVIVCGFCFWLGYGAGRRSSVEPKTAGVQSAAGQSIPTQASGSLSKPPAKGLIPSAPAQPAIAEVTQLPPADGSSTGNPLTSYAPVGNGSSAAVGQTQVRPALPKQANGPQPLNAPAGGLEVQPALTQAAGLMVQVAAVSHVEDASVLVAALRRRGYEVTARREGGDGLIHVQIGPFTNRNDANAMCQRLLSDGYNAIVQP